MNDKIYPKLFSSLKKYNKNQFLKDVIAGVIVAIIALPLSIALALASGVKPEQGLYTAITAGFVIAFLGGSKVQISGPTAAFATIVAGIVAQNGMSGLVAATFIAGLILILMGVCGLGKLIKFIPQTITTGFTTGIALTLIIGQIKDFLGLTFNESPIETIEKLKEVVLCIGTFNFEAFIIGMLSLIILVVSPKIIKKIPPSLIAVIICAAVVKIFKMDVNTIGSLYEISSNLPSFKLPSLSLETVRNIIPDAFTIAILAAIESLLSCVVSDGMIGSKHSPNTELVAQGAGNIVSALFGGIPATGAIARTAANVKNGGRTPVSGIVHAVVLLFVLVFFMPYASLIPMPTIAAILFVVAYNMSEYKQFISLIKTSPKSDVFVLVVTFVLTVVFDLVVAIGVGIVLACVLFMARMSEVAEVRSWKKSKDDTEENLLPIPDGTFVYELNGPMFFGAADKIADMKIAGEAKVIIVRMSKVPAIDTTALGKLEVLVKKCNKNGIRILFSHVNEQPLKAMKKSGIYTKIGKENFCSDINSALITAEEHISV